MIIREWDGQDWAEFTPGTVTPVVEPVLVVERADAQTIRLTWASDATEFLLESTSVLADPPSWTLVPNAPQSAPFSVLVPTSAAAQFYRLRKP